MVEKFFGSRLLALLKCSLMEFHFNWLVSARWIVNMVSTTFNLVKEQVLEYVQSQLENQGAKLRL